MCDNPSFDLPPLYDSHDFYGSQELLVSSDVLSHVHSAAVSRQNGHIATNIQAEQRRPHNHSSNSTENSIAESQSNQNECRTNHDSSHSLSLSQSQSQVSSTPTSNQSAANHSHTHLHENSTSHAGFQPRQLPYDYQIDHQSQGPRSFPLEDYGRLMQDTPSLSIPRHRCEPDDDTEYVTPHKKYRVVMALSCVVICIFCMPLGLVAYQFARRARLSTDPDKAESYATTSTILSIIGIVVGFILIPLLVLAIIHYEQSSPSYLG